MGGLVLAGAQVPLFLLGVLGAGLFLAGVWRISRGDRADAFAGMLLGTVGLFLAGIGFLAPYAAPGGL